MMNKVEYKNILIVEDNDGIRASLTEYFSAANSVTACADLASAIEAAATCKFDAVILDVILPDGSGLKLIEHLHDSPVIILSDLGNDSNMLDGFSAGATDYIVKPASPQIIEARISLRLLPDSKAEISSHGLTVNTSKRTAKYNGKMLELTSSEFNILLYLMRNAGKFRTAAEIYESIWNMPHLKTATIKVHISNLRKKMLAVSPDCANLLIQEFNKGYAFIDE